ncbi:xanthine dehydrogenase family protein molybdopterin-binding subunit [Acidocella sp.]|uniref:xanthine dehydrogenase family protein molybdopterin-binding subunit n=1 Tax=Acidocella sp. TaxID=50710 RepID=UPI00262983D1|nr:xanthine dehydrogenase family protein molybdopterin-binding subunit [Acidocella sp.]
MNETTPIAAGRFIGQRMPRKEDPRLLTGRGTFVDDISFPGMLHVAFVRSPIARGKITGIDLSVARGMPGVHAVYTAADLAKIKVTPLSFFLTPSEVEVPLLATDHVAYAGDPVVLIVADDRYLAEDAASVVTVDYEEEDPVVSLADARNGALVHPGTESNVSAAMGLDEDEDGEALLAGAAHLINRTVIHQRISQSPMETRGIVVSKQGAGELLVHITCQSPHMIARYLTIALGMPEYSIRVLAKDVGGSFGLKNTPWREELAVIAAALLLGRPLKWIEDRLENLISANQAREQEMTMRVGFDGQGKLLAARGEYSSNNGAYPQGADANVAVHMFMWAAYKIPYYSFYTQGWYSNTVGLAAYRGPWALESLIREAMLDIAARQLGIDPVEIRRRNLVTLADQPTATTMGIPLEDITPAECLEKLLTVLDIDAFRREQAAARQEGRHLGLGIATYIEPTGSAGSMPVMTGELAQLRVEPTGKVTATMSTHSQGHGTQTTMAQVIADRLGVPYEDVTVFEGDSAHGGFGPGAAGSRQGVIGGGASLKAAGLLQQKVKTLAAHLLNANVEDVSLEGGVIHVAGSPEMTRSLRQIAEIAYGEPARLPPGFEAGLEAQYRYTPPPMTFTSAAHGCIVEVDIETGFVKILRWISSEDCGNVINPAVVEGQIAGGLAQAIGMVLLEEAGYDARGNPIAVTFKDYLLPAISDVPDFEYVHASTPSQSEGGFRGVGEGGAIIGPPTLFNAIADALSPFGEVPLTLPLTPTRLLEVIEGRSMTSVAHAPAPVAPVVTEVAPAPVAAPAPPAAPARVDGLWKMVMASPMGGQEMKGRLATEGTTLTGTLLSDQGNQDFAGSIEGNRLKWEMKVTKPVSLTLKYDLVVEGDSISGKVKMGMFGTAKLTGERLE